MKEVQGKIGYLIALIVIAVIWFFARRDKPAEKTIVKKISNDAVLAQVKKAPEAVPAEKEKTEE